MISSHCIEKTYYDIQARDEETRLHYDVQAVSKDESFQELLGDVNITFLQGLMLKYRDEDKNLILSLEQLQRIIKKQLNLRGYHGELKPIGSTKSQLKTLSLDELDLAFLIDENEGHTARRSTIKSHVYEVQKTGSGCIPLFSHDTNVNPREVREKFAKDVQDILCSIELPPGLQHSGYAAPEFSGVRYNGPATTMLLTWDPEGEKREISMDITPMLHMPSDDEACMKDAIKKKISHLNREMPYEILRYDGMYLFPNPISDQWELTSACYEATSLLDRIPRDTPFKTSILMCKTLASKMASLPLPSSVPTEEPTEPMTTIVSALTNPTDQTLEYMKYGHAFLTPENGRKHQEMTKKAISINTAAITHIALHLTIKISGAFTSKHDSKQHKRITVDLMSQIFSHFASAEMQIEHFFIGSRMSYFSVATWAREIHDTSLLVNNIKTQCLMMANLLKYGITGSHSGETTALQQYRTPAGSCYYAEDSFSVPVHFTGKNCNRTFSILLKLINALGNTTGGVILVYDEEIPDANKFCERRLKVDKLAPETQQDASAQVVWRNAFESLCSARDVLVHLSFAIPEPSALFLIVSEFSEPTPFLTYAFELETVCGKDSSHGASLCEEQLVFQIESSGDITQRHTKTTESGLHLRVPSTAQETQAVCHACQPSCTDTDQTSSKSDTIGNSAANSGTEQAEPSIEEHGHTKRPSLKFWKKCTKLGWTRNKRNWKKDLHQVHIDIDATLNDLIHRRTSILQPTEPMTFIPSKEAILRRHPKLDETLECIADMMGENEVIAIACQSWLKQAGINTRGISEPTSLIMDIVAINKSGGLHIFCLVDSNNDLEDSKAWEYVISVGQATKRAICRKNRTCNVHIQCHLHALKTQRTLSSLVMQKHVKLENVLLGIAQILIKKTSGIRDRLGEDLNIVLTAKQLETLLLSVFEQFVLIEGPPGCGKTYMAFHLCSMYDKRRVLYICCTTAFRDYLIYQDNCTPELVQCSEEMKKIPQRFDLSKYHCVIIDDAHQLSCSYKTWKGFFDAVLKSSCRVYILMDSQYQNFQDVDLQPLRKCIAEQKNNASQHQLKVIHRNSRKVSSFIVSTTGCCSVQHSGELSVSSQVEGQDVQVHYLSSIFKTDGNNELWLLIKSLLQNQKDEDDNIYDSQDIAILIDTRKPREDVNRLKQILQAFDDKLRFHSASHFPVEGITIDTLDNFVGFDRPVCICVTHSLTAADKMRKHVLKKNQLRHILNPKYRLFVASRGVSSVIFVVDHPISSEEAIAMKLDVLPFKPHRLWMKKGHLADPSWMTVSGKSALLFSSYSDMCLVSASGTPLSLELDISKIRDPWAVDCLQDGSCILIADGRIPFSWNTYRRESGWRYKPHATYILDGNPTACRWTPDGDVVLVVELGEVKGSELRRYHGPDGRLMWKIQDVGYVCQSRLSVSADTGNVLLADNTRIVQMYSPQGELIHSVKLAYNRIGILSFCAIGDGRWLSGDQNGSVILWGSDKDDVGQVLMQKDNKVVWSLALSKDGLLALRTSGDYDSVMRLYVYNISGPLV